MKLTIQNPSDFTSYFERLMREPANRQAYLASRAWQMLRQQLGQRSNGSCERCGSGKFEVAHHLTYIHFGEERLHELQAICRACHNYLHAKTDVDPARDIAKQERLF